MDKSIEKKWQQRWQDSGLYKFDNDNIANKYYVLEMFSYPSGANLHIGHWYNFGLSDSFARFKKMCGYNVFQPMGFDAFGLPAENYAIKTGIHPSDSTYKNIAKMREQLKQMGAMFNWEAELVTCTPEYYKWTQWLFIQLFNKGLAYRKKAPVNWCTDCNTVLANEQVIDGKCDRCGHEVIKKELTQWFFKITEYAEELLNDLDNLDWPEKTKSMQRNWIGKSQGGEIEFTALTGQSLKVFTTRADTLFGVSYIILAPEHPLVEQLTTADRKQAVDDYKNQIANLSEIDRLSTARPKSGVFIGSYAINPINNAKVPIWIGDYVLYSYGTGCVMGVPAHDERDFVFANKYNLPITRVISGDGNIDDSLPFVEYGKLVNSGEFNSLGSQAAMTKILNKLASTNKGGTKTNYRLRDWLISRQRYWGAPIPIIYCDKCGEVAEKEENLPVQLPYNVNFTPDGTSPLNKCDEFVNTICPKCGGKARREVDTMDTFVCSSWYFLRYCDNLNSKQAFDKNKIKLMMPVDKYVGGVEHACMHLLYARFFTKSLRDMGYLDIGEPFKSLVHQGSILGADGEKMSKSKGNTISPDDYIDEYGSDVFRCYMGFGFKYIDGGPWSDDGIKAVAKWLDRVERIVSKVTNSDGTVSAYDDELRYILNSTIGSVRADYEEFSFNTAIARMMELSNALSKYEVDTQISNPKLYKECCIALIKMLAPLAPHICEQLWENIGQPYSIFNAKFPTVDLSALVKQQVELALQVNAKIKGKLIVPTNYSEEQIKQAALNSDVIAPLIKGLQVVKVIVVADRLVNIIVK